jgi:two-component SAPR family response regulator
MRAIVLDDEPLIADHIARLLANSGHEVTGCFSNPFEALEAVRSRRPDVLFLDISMPGMSGLELAERIYEDDLDTEVVFVTAYNQFAIEAFRVNAIDYLLKPVMEKDVARTLERIGRRLRQRAAIASQYADSGLHPQMTVSLFGKFAAHAGDGTEPIRWVTSKCAELFAYILLQHGDKEVTKWQLFEALWQNKDAEKADINLRSTVSRINRTLREWQTGLALVSVRNGYRLTATGPMPVVDADQLERFALDVVQVGPDNRSDVEQLLFRCHAPLLQEFSSEASMLAYAKLDAGECPDRTCLVCAISLFGATAYDCCRLM